MFVISGTGHVALMGRCALQGALLSLECALPAQAHALHAGLPYIHRAEVSTSSGKMAGPNRIVYKSAGRACVGSFRVAYAALGCTELAGGSTSTHGCDVLLPVHLFHGAPGKLFLAHTFGERQCCGRKR